MNTDKIAILVDSGSDVPPALIEKYGMYQIPLKINFSDGEYLDGITISAKEVYERLNSEVPKTSLPDGESINNILDRIKADGYEKLFVVCISSGLSGTCNIVRLLCEDYEGLECFVLDSKNISIGSGMLAIQAAEYLNAGMLWEELIRVMPQKVSKSKVFFCVKTLEYLQKGGRIGKVAAVLGSAIALKPVISCNEEGVYDIVSKCIGRKASIRKIVELAEQYAKQGGQAVLALMNGNAPEEAAEVLEDLKSHIPNAILSVQGQISPALGVHTGPGLIGIGVYIG